jgi:hypothetical protein
LSLKGTRFGSTVKAVLTTTGGLDAENLVCSGKAHLSLIMHTGGKSSLKNMHFEHSADFGNSSIKHPAIFDGLSVGGDASFAGVLFESAFNCVGADFRGAADFRAAGTGNTFAEIHFADSHFRMAAIFFNRKFTSSTDFGNCFFGQAPRFEGATIHQATIFPPESQFNDVSSTFATSAYRTLKLAMESARARREEAIFYSLEQKSLRRRKQDIPFFDRLASYLYDFSTRYGQSFTRPLLLLLVVAAVSAAWYAIYISPIIDWSAEFDSRYVRDGVEFSVAQIVNPFGIWRLTSTSASDVTLGVKLLATLESILTTALLALFLLGLRWRFKRE